MALMSFRDIRLAFGLAPLLDGIDFSLEAGERIAIVGRNGAGKSSLLKIIAKEFQADSGEVMSAQGLQVAKLAQEVPDNIQGNVYEVIAQGLGEVGTLWSQYQTLIEQGEHLNKAELQSLERLHHALDEHHAWDVSHRIENVITRLALPSAREFSELSGGLKRRVLLGQLLVKEPQILLLDEPTNHLDIEAIQWLEQFLKEYKGTVIFITHDRTFLNTLATRILELDRGQIRSYPGNYTEYQTRKSQELEIEATHNKLFDKKLAQEEVWIRQGIKARRTRNEGRVRALEALRSQSQERRKVQGKVKMATQNVELSGKVVIEAVNISHTYNHQTLVRDFSTVLMRGDKIGLIGPNGSGKTTLLRILLGELKPQKGDIKQGTRLEIAYFDQLRSQLEEEKSVADNVSYGDQYVMFNGASVHIMTYLQNFLFSPERARTPVKVLSGGERNRLLLARLLSKPSNVLVLDEPTNDLDVETLELLEELLIDYQGTVLLVSHDRSFLNNVVTSTIVFEGEGRIEEYLGGYDDWLRQKGPSEKNNREASDKAASKKTARPVKEHNAADKKALQVLEQKIEKLELKQHQLEETLMDQALYLPSAIDTLSILQKELAALKAEIKSLIKKWEDLV